MSLIQLDTHQHVATVTLNRPEQGNSIDLASAKEMMDVAISCSEDENIRSVVLTGAGKAFCVGGDIKTFAADANEIGAASDLASRISTSYCEACLEWRHMSQKMGRMALHHLVVAPMDWPESILQSLMALEVFADEYEALPDLIKADNLMLRKDGTLVFSDPFFMG